MAEVIYKAGDVIVAKREYGDGSEIGVVDHDFNDGDSWVRCTTKSDPNMTSFRVPGLNPELDCSGQGTFTSATARRLRQPLLIAPKQVGAIRW